MNTVFSHIIRKSFSQQYENVATDALAFILGSNDSARSGFVKILRGINSDLPNHLQFRTQHTDANTRPDLWGYDGAVARVFVENKFWAGLTENQPVNYLKLLAGYSQASVLLVVVPAAREETLWRELLNRLKNANIALSSRGISAGVVRSVKTEIGTTLALISWGKLLSAIEAELTDESAKNDLRQLKSLCDAADESQAFKPFSSTELMDQQTPSFILQLSTIVQEAVELAVTKGILSIERVNPQSDWERIGRYAWFSTRNGAGVWFGTHLKLWRKHGGTPLWLVFHATNFGRALEVGSLLEPWAARNGVFSANEDDHFAIAIDLVTGEEKDEVIRSIVDRLRSIAEVLSKLEPIDRSK